MIVEDTERKIDIMLMYWKTAEMINIFHSPVCCHNSIERSYTQSVTKNQEQNLQGVKSWIYVYHVSLT